MDKIIVKGGKKLNGSVEASGSKNSALPLLFATLLCDGKHVFHNVPFLKDIESTSDLLGSLGAKTYREDKAFVVDVQAAKDFKADYNLVRKMRASILCLGPLLARYGEAVVSLPGGCAIGTRPIDKHLDAMKEMGAELDIKQGYVFAKAERLTGANIVFDGVTVGGTENVLMAAVLAEGVTTIENAAKEPEIKDLADYLIKMGAQIEGAGTSIIKVTGVKELKPAKHKVISDRIEVGTLLLAGAITGGETTVTNCNPGHIEALTQKLKESGFEVTSTEDSITLHKATNWKGLDITTAPYPGFATDLQAQFMAVMTQAEGSSVITENIFENRFMHVQELNRLSANITPRTHVAIVRGEKGGLIGAPVMATDLRASASLILAGLVAKGTTEVSRVYHLDRGYENLEKKLAKLGADIHRVN